MTVREVTWSAFLREPGIVDALLKKGDVVLKRRDGEALRLSLESRGHAESEALAVAARLLAPMLAKETSVAGTAAAQLPWTRFLSAEDRNAFLHEFLGQFEACADLGDFSALGRLLAQWKSTASLHAEGLGARLAEPIRSVGDRVRRPVR